MAGFNFNFNLLPPGVPASLTNALSKGVSYDPAATALFARFTTPPTAARKTLINDMIVSLKDAGVWAKLDALYVTAAADSQAARRNWVADAFNMTAVSGPSFTTDRGYTGDGSASHLTTGFGAATAGGKYAQNDAHMGIWTRTNLLNSAITSYDAGGPNSGLRRSSDQSGRMDGRASSGSEHIIAVGAYPGHGGFSRLTSTSFRGYAQGVDVGGGANASGALSSTAFCIGRWGGGGYGVNQIAAYHFGSSLSATEWLALKNALTTYLQAVGAV